MEFHLDALDGLGEQGCREYIEFLLHNYRVLDAFWFIRVEEAHGLAEAEALNAAVWGKVAQLAARDIKKRFGIPDNGGLQALQRAQQFFPWHMLVGYEIQDRGDHLLIEVDRCPPQDGRKKHGLGEYACKQMHMNEFSAFAQEVDLYCRWRFVLEGTEREDATV
jgi:hypothetical protein